MVAAGLIDKGILFHNIGAAIMNAQSPIVSFVLNSRTFKWGGGEGGCYRLLRFFGIFSQTIKHQHLRFSVAVRVSLDEFWDKLSDSQVLWLRDMTS